MTKPKRANFSPEFRLETAHLFVDQGYKVRSSVEAMGIGKSTMDKWVRQLRVERQVKTSTGKSITEDKRRIWELAKQVKRLKAEKEVLKKALGSLRLSSHYQPSQQRKAIFPHICRT